MKNYKNGMDKKVIVKKTHENRSVRQWIRAALITNSSLASFRIVQGHKFKYLICPEAGEHGMYTSLRLIPLNQDCREYPAVRMFLGPAAIRHIKKWWLLELEELDKNK